MEQQQLRTHAFDSAIGGWCWLISLGVLVAAFAWQRAPSRGAGEDGVADAPADTAGGLPRWAEITIFLGILALGFGLRLYRLGDWTTGMHGDEGEAGVDALGILAGNGASPFATGWFSQPNFYYWGIALTMRVFGTDLFGLRMFAALAGSLMLIPFYPLVRQWFGVRGAIIATFLLAVSDVAIHFSKQEFSNITTPLFLVTGFFFFFRGLRNRRLINFVLAGYAHILSMYFYLGGRLTPILVIAFLAYLFLLMPLVRLPGAYQAIRRRLPRLGRGGAAARAVAAEARGVAFYGHQIMVYTLACIFFVSPWLAYFVDHQAEWNSRADEKLILNNAALMVQQYGVQHGPLYLGVRPPTPSDIWPVPLVFEQTPVSIRLLPLPWESAAAPSGSPLLQDGFWARAMWDQLTATLSILTYRGDASSVYTFTSAPAAKPIEAALIILGIAWAAWRWRDTRMALLTLWFWSTVLVGGVLTIDAPYMARLVGVIPTLAVFAMLPLDKLATEIVRLAGRVRRPARLPRAALAFSSVAIAALFVFLGGENFNDYYNRYEAQLPAPFAEVTGQAYFVRQVNTALAQAGRPPAKFYDVGAHLIYWGHGDNRFLNNGVEGLDMVNASNELPIVENGPDNASDVYFMVWSLDQQYLSVLRAYYPDAVEIPYYYPSADHGTLLFTAVHVTREQIDARRVLQATYTPAQGAPVQRQEAGLGTSGPPPAGLAYPVQAQWAGSLVAPAFGRYRFAIAGAAGRATARRRDPGGDGARRRERRRGVDPRAGRAHRPADRHPGRARHGGAVDLGAVRASPGARGGALPLGGAGARADGRDPPADRRAVRAPARGHRGPGCGAGDRAAHRRLPGLPRCLDRPERRRAAGGRLARHAQRAARRDLPVQRLLERGQPDHDRRAAGGRQPDGGDRRAPAGRQRRADAGPARLRPALCLVRQYRLPGSLLGATGREAGAAGARQPADRWRHLATRHGYRARHREPNAAGIGCGGRARRGDPRRSRHAGPAARTGGRARPHALCRRRRQPPGGRARQERAAHGDLGQGRHRPGRVQRAGGRRGGTRRASLRARTRTCTACRSSSPTAPSCAISARTSCVPRRAWAWGPTAGSTSPTPAMAVCASSARTACSSRDLTAGTDPATRLDQPVDVAVGSDGTVFVADLRNRVIRIDPATDAIVQSWPLPIGTSLGAANLAVLGDCGLRDRPGPEPARRDQRGDRRDRRDRRGGHGIGPVQQSARHRGRRERPDLRGRQRQPARAGI